MRKAFFLTALLMVALDMQPESARAQPTTEADRAARAHCDLAEMQLRTGKLKDAQASAKPFVHDPLLSRSRFRDQGRYYYGFASFLLKDYGHAEQVLTMLAPFTQPEYGTHGRYLLARTHDLTDEKAEAMFHYEGTMDDYQKSKARAANLLKTPQKLASDPAERARLENLVKAPVPDHVARAGFYLGMLLYEAGKFADAKNRFTECAKLNPHSPLRLEADMRIGLCQVQLKEFSQAVNTLRPLVDKDARLADQVLFWLAKAQVGAAPDRSSNQAGFTQSLSAALGTLRQAQDRAQRLQGQDADAKERRALILLEMADTMQTLKQPKDAGNIYSQLLADKNLPDRMEEIGLRLASALHLAGDYNESDKQCARFLAKHPRSTLVPAILFCQAENSYFRGLTAEKTQSQTDVGKEVARLNDETIKRLTLLIDKYPEFPKINVARYTLGLSYYKKGEFDAARKALDAIPGPERTGELAPATYLMADCILRQTPTALPEDALAAGKLEKQLKSAADLLEGFLADQPKGSQAADALLKYGLCQQRLASLLSQPPEKAKALTAARGAYEKMVSRDFANSPLVPQAYLERAKVIAATGDTNGAINELRRYSNEPFKNAKIAPMALIHLATWLRAQNKALEAADVLGKARSLYEAKVAADAERAGWLVLLRFHHGAALQEAGKLAEARQIFDLVVKMGSNRPEGAEAALRLGQCLKDEGRLFVEKAHKMSNPKESAAALKLGEQGYQLVGEAIRFLESQVALLNKKDNLQEVRARMLYDAAWGSRILAEREVSNARAVIFKEMMKEQGPRAAKFGPIEIPIDSVPLQPAEKRTRLLYEALIEAIPEQPLASEARFELAELLALRNEHDAAIKLLTETLDKEPSPELTEKVRLRLGSSLAFKGNLKAALAQFDAVAGNPKSPLIGWAHYSAGEALLHNQQYTDAIKRLTRFRDQQPFQNQLDLSDRALLRLGHAFAMVKDWDASRRALERLVNNFPKSLWCEDARFGMGWALQQQNNLDGAVNLYTQVTTRTARAVAAKAQLQIGLCRLQQKRFTDAANALLVVPLTYDYPELSAAALLDAARAYQQGNQRDQAVQLLQRIIRDYPNTPFAEAAQEKLTEKKLK